VCSVLVLTLVVLLAHHVKRLGWREEDVRTRSLAAAKPEWVCARNEGRIAVRRISDVPDGLADA
jgi:hypothetical protein